MMTGRVALMALPVLAACGPRIEVPVVTPSTVARATLFERAVDNLVVRFRADETAAINDVTAPCIVGTSTAAELIALATAPNGVDAVLQPMLLRAPTRFCLQGGAL